MELSPSIHVLAASYDDAVDALADFRTVVAAPRPRATAAYFDAAVTRRHAESFEIVAKWRDQGTAAARFALWTFGIPAVVALVSRRRARTPVVYGCAVAAGASVAVGRAASRIDRRALEGVVEPLAPGRTGLLVLYSTDILGARHVEMHETRMEAPGLTCELAHGEPLAL